MKFRVWSMCLLLLLLIVLVVGCNSEQGTDDVEASNNKENESSTKPVQGGEMLLGYYSDASSYDPLLASSGGDESLLYFIYETLVTYGPGFEPLPGLAVSWENKDDKTWVLNLREDVTFHDGTKFDAEAVKFNIERANSSSSNKSDLNLIESVEVIDHYTVALHLNEPNSGLLQNLMTAAGMMVSPTAIEEYGEDYALNPVGTGPFSLIDRVPNNEIQFERYDDYWQEGKPYLDKLTVKVMQENTMINALKSGEIQVAAPISAANMEELDNSANITVDASPSLNFQYIFINTSIAPLDNEKVRLAMQYALDREQIVNAIQFGNGEAAYGLYPEEHPSYEESTISLDKEKAKQLLEESGVEDLTFDMLVKPDAFDVRIGEAVKAQLADVGIEVNLHPTEVTKLVELAFSNPEYPATLARASGRPDPNALLSLYFKEDSFYNPGGHLNEEFNKLILEAAAETDEAARNDIIAKANQIVMEQDAMGIPIFFEPMIVAFNDKVKGYEPHLYGKPRFPYLWVEE